MVCHLLPRSIVAAAILTGVVAGFTPNASADQLTGEGSLTDTQNIANAAVSDASADLSLLITAGNTGYGTCGGYTAKPAARYDSASPTLEQIWSPIVVQCSGYNHVYLNFDLERSRWWGWQSLAHRDVDHSGYNFSYNRDIATNCRAGTWSYRVYISGGWNGHSGYGMTKTFRKTCVDRNNLNFVDLS